MAERAERRMRESRTRSRDAGKRSGDEQDIFSRLYMKTGEKKVQVSGAGL